MLNPFHAGHRTGPRSHSHMEVPTVSTRRLFAPLVVLALAVVIGSLPAPAQAKNTLLHFKFARALAANPLDSSLVTLSQTSFDTTEYVFTDPINPIAAAALDTSAAAGGISAAGAIAHTPVGGGLYLVVEVTGAMQTMDSLYAGIQFSQGSTTPANGSSGDQNNPLNWRWYNGLLTSAAGLVENATSSKTFVWPVPCQVAGPNAWVAAKAIRFVIQGDNTSAAKAFSTRAWLVSRD